MAALQTLCVYLVIVLVVAEENEMDTAPANSIVLKNESDCALHLQNPAFSSLSSVSTREEAESSITNLQEQPLTSNCTLSSRVETTSRHSQRMKNTNQYHIAAEKCPPWYIPVYDNGTITACKCGNSLGGIVACNSFYNHYESRLLPCFCMTYKEHDLNTAVVGHCLYGCYDRDWLHYRISAHTDLEKVCAKFSRTGQLCGRCQEGFAPPVYSFHISCVECEKHTSNWLKYAAVAFGPLTLFLFIVIVFRISVTLAPLNAFVFTTQVATSPLVMRVVVGFQERGAISTAQSLPLKFLSSLFGIWNLDFFRLVYKPFCLNPRASMIQVLAMDYIVAVYPLVLIGAAYTFVVLHDNRFQLIVWVWRPFHKCLSRFRRRWKIKSSLIGAFATFLLLSYSKFLAVSFDLLMPTPVYLDNGKTLGRFLYYAGTVELFGHEHRPYAVLAVLILAIVTVIPLLLLCLYPCHFFQRCLNCSGLRCAALHAFVDVFQMDYKDGSGNIQDCRYFSAVYLIVRIIFTGVYAATLNCYYFVVTSFILIIVALSLISIQPYKNDNHNRLDAFLILVLAVFHLSSAGLNVFPSVIRAFTSLSVVLLAVSVLTIFLYQVILLFHWILARQRLPQRILEQVQYLLNCLHLRPRNHSSYDELFPDHLHCTVDTNEHTSLLPQPVPDDEEM